jgi:hypothetical protein
LHSRHFAVQKAHVRLGHSKKIGQLLRNCSFGCYLLNNIRDA